MLAEIRQYNGPLGSHLKAFIEEKRRLGCKYIEEERLSFEFDKLSLRYDCSNGIPSDLVLEFVKCKPNWQATTQKRHISFVQYFGRYLQNHDVSILLPGYTALKKIDRCFSPYIFTHDQIRELFDFY